MKRHLFALGMFASLLHAPGWAHGPAPHGAKPPKAKIDPAPVQTAFGRSGDADKVTRTITIDMTDDLHFLPEAIEVRRGETIRIVAVNRGAAMHEIVLGTTRELADHAELMKKHPAMEHDEPFMAHVPPGGRGEIVWQFDQPGTFRFACLIPGHTWNELSEGMVGTIVVKPENPL